MEAEITVEGVNGASFRVHGPGAGAEGVHLGKGPEGLYDLPVRTLWAKSSYKPGATFSGVRYDPADVVLMFMVVPQPGQTWEAAEAAFLQAFSYEKDCSLCVQTPESGLRTLRVRMLDAPKMRPDFDPHVDGYSEITMTLRAADPFWWGALEAQPVTPSGADGSTTMTLTNRGDREMWPVWEKTGTGRWTLPDTPSGGSNPRRITMPQELSSVPYVVDTDPYVEQIVAPGFPGAWASMGVVRFINPVPPGASFTVPVSWQGRSSGGVTLLTRPRYSRPWGG